jgi:hypothetical protein
MISTLKAKIRQRIAIVKSCRMFGTSSPTFRRMLFSTYVMPLFKWLFAIFPLFTVCQKDDLSQFYFTCLKKTLEVLHWNDFLFSALFEEKTLENLCYRYWERYRKVLNSSVDGSLLFEQLAWKTIWEQWLHGNFVVKWVYRSRRLIPHLSIIRKCLRWVENRNEDAIPIISDPDFDLLSSFSLSFMQKSIGTPLLGI